MQALSELDTENDADVSSEDAPAIWDVTFLVSCGDVIATVVAPYLLDLYG